MTWARSEREASAAAYMPLNLDPGEAYQFHWSHEIVVIDSVTTTVKSKMRRNIKDMRGCLSPYVLLEVKEQTS